MMLIFTMPANLPPEYYEAEKRFKEAASPSEKIIALEDLIAKVPKHKGTDKLRADLRRRLSKLKEDAVKRKKGGKGDLYNVEREGAAQVALLGFANSGKSSILASVTNAHPVVADYPMSTVLPLSGMMPFEDIQFQLVDLPPVGNEASDGWVSGIVRIADMVLIIVDLSDDPDVQLELMIDMLLKWRVIEPLEGGGYGGKRTLVAANKLDLPGAREAFEPLNEKFGGSFGIMPVSTATKDGIEDMRLAVFKTSGIVRVYSKEPGKEPDFDMPFTMPGGSTVLELARKIHKNFASNLKHACIWGSARFDGQKVRKDYVFHDRDVVEIHI